MQVSIPSTAARNLVISGLDQSQANPEDAEGHGSALRLAHQNVPCEPPRPPRPATTRNEQSESGSWPRELKTLK